MLVNQNSTITYLGDDVTTQFIINFVFFNPDQIAVAVDNVLLEQITDYTIGSDPDVINFVVPPALDAEIEIFRDTLITQDVDYVQGQPFDSDSHEIQMDRMVMKTIENEREIEETKATYPDNLDPDQFLITDEFGKVTVGGPSATVANLSGTVEAFENTIAAQITAGQTAIDSSVTDAEAARIAAELAETNAQNSQLQATTAATQSLAAQSAAEMAQISAEDAAAASQWRDVVYLTAADSPYNITMADSGIFFSVDASAGNFVFNLPTISSLDLSGARPFFGGKKQDSTMNTVTANASGGDEINSNGTSIFVDVQNNGYRFIPDTDLTPDSWATIAIASASGSTDPASLLGTGGRVVTDAADMIAGSGQGMVAGSGFMQVQNAAGDDAYMQVVSDQLRLSSNLTKFNWPVSSQFTTSTFILSEYVNLVASTTPGQEVQLDGSVFTGVKGYITLASDQNPWTIRGINGASLIGGDITLRNVGDSVLIHQISQIGYVVVASNLRFDDRAQTKILAADSTTDGEVLFDFQNLIVGRTYELSVNYYVSINGASGAAGVQIFHGTDSLGISWVNLDTTSTERGDRSTYTTAPFVATSSSVRAQAAFIQGASDRVHGNGTLDQTHATLRELNNLDITTDFT